MEKAIVLVSGGLNSAVAAAVAREQYEIHLLHLNWGHRSAERELASYNAVAAHLRVERLLTVDAGWMSALGGNARTCRKIPIEDLSALRGDTPPRLSSVSCRCC